MFELKLNLTYGQLDLLNDALERYEELVQEDEDLPERQEVLNDLGKIFEELKQKAPKFE